MGLFNDSLSYAVDTTAIQAGDLNFGDKAGGVVAGAVISGLGSIYNTGVAVNNALGGNAEAVDTYNKLSELDDNWATYYKENQAAIDVVGFIGTSLLPGSLAVKGLNAVRAGEGVGAFGRALNIPRTMQSRYLSRAIAELETAGGTVFTRLNANKIGTMTWEFADQTLQAAAFELGVALTMKQSPLLADDSWWDIGKGIATGAVLGGVIGGGIQALALNKSFKSAITEIDKRAMGYTAIEGSGLAKFDISAGDKAYGLLDSVMKIPDNVLSKDAILEVAFQLGSGPVSKKVDLTKVLTDVAKGSTKTAMQEFELQLRKIASGEGAATGGSNPEGAAALADFVLGKFASLKQKGATPAQIREEVGDYLLSLRKVVNATEDSLYTADDLFYFKQKLTPEDLAGVKGVEDLRDRTVRTTPFDKNAYEKPYIFMGTQEELANMKLARIGAKGEDSFANLKEAWEAGYNMAMNSDGTLRINPSSGKWKRVVDPVFDPRRYLNTRTGALSDTAVLSAADRVKTGTQMKITSNVVEYETTAGRVTHNMREFNPKGSTEYFTARHAWASKLATADLPGVIDAKDISLLARLKAVDDEELLAEIIIKNADGSYAGNGLQAGEVLFNARVDGIRDTLAAGQQDLRELAYKYATDEKWIERLIETEFGSALSRMDSLMENSGRDLTQFLRRENVIAYYERPHQFTALEGASENLPFAQKREMILAQASANGGQFVTGELAYAYRIQNADKALKNSTAAVLGGEAAASLIPLAQDASKLANSLGSGASFLGAANASYGEVLKLATQDIGKKVHQWVTKASDDVTAAMSTASTRIINNKVAAAEVGIVTNVLRNDAGKFVAIPTGEKTLILKELSRLTGDKLREAEAALVAQGRRTRIEIKEEDAWEFFVTHQKLNAERVSKHTVLVNARGMTSNKDPNVFYAPPIDTNYFQHFAFVRPVDGKAFGTSEVSMVFGRDAAELQRRIAAVDKNNFEVITKDGSERYFKAKGEYDFDQTINERTIDSELRRTGALANFFPETRAQNIVEDYLRFHQNQATKLVRNAVENNYAQQIEELRALGKSFAEDATSKFSGTLRSAKSEIVNPYDDYVKTMLDVSKRSEYTFFHQANEFVDALGTRAYRLLADVTGKASKGQISWTEANAIAERHGISGMYSSETDYFLSNVPRDRNLVKEYVAKANTLLSNLVLRFDFAQSIMNVISTPLLLSTEMVSIRNLVAKDDALAGALRELTAVKVPGQDAAVPSTLKLLHGAIKNWFGQEQAQLIKRYTDNGDIKASAALYHEAVRDLSLSPDFKVFSDKVNKVTEKVATLTGNNWAEDFTRFVSADVMRQVTEPLVAAGKLDVRTQNAYISTFVNRVQGNYITSQRPVVFQGVLGGAIGLFQTYSFNLLQQLLRHVEAGDKKSVATLFGMQSGLFGLNGTPMFDAVNTHIIGNASVNQGHYDAYSIAPQLLGKEVGDWLLYGTASAMPGFGDKWPALYTRGDINPRHMTILPMTPMQVPAIDASIRVVKNLLDVGGKLVQGANVGPTLLQGLEHNGLNRPLAGIAQVLQGHSTTSKGGLISANSDMELIANASRIIGAKPMDEAVALNNLYRMKAYTVADNERMSTLGERVKSSLVGNKVPSDSDFLQFMEDYTKIGGRAENFHAAMNRWMRDANTSVVEQVRRKQNSPEARRLNEIMGSVPLGDYRSQPE
jgi:hypothetical protein